MIFIIFYKKKSLTYYDQGHHWEKCQPIAQGYLYNLFPVMLVILHNNDPAELEHKSF